jgi:hypothetical protein
MADAPGMRTNQPNGTPDYIDETAWALDSAWHMEIDRFGFPPPYPYKDSLRSSDKYKVLVQLPEESGVYGVTLFDQRMDTNSFSSFITIRNEWSGFDTEPLKYDIDPTPAIHVTCAHEFFHAIQYGMTWDMKSIGGTKDPTSLDDFPLTWTEGCGAFMEELAFPEIDDYIQYALPYFFDPETASFFSQDHINSNPYFTTLFLLFQKTRLSATDDIDFLKQMYFNNYMKYLPFKENLSYVLNKSHFTWPEVLNRFHTSSFFTGTRADTSIFINDAAKFIDWNVNKVAPSIQNIRENSLGLYSIKKQNIHYDSLFINLQPEMSDTEQAEPDSWAASALLRHGKSTVITPFELDKYGKGSLIVPDWKAQDECIVAVSSGFSDSDRKFSVDFTPCQITHDSGSIDTIYNTTNRNATVFAIIQALSNLRCELSFSKIPITSKMASEALMNNLQLFDSMFTINFPHIWADEAKITLIVDHISPDLKLCMWQQDSLKWFNISDTNRIDGAIHVNLSVGQKFGFFKTIQSTANKSLLVYPNPAHINSGKGVNFIGYDIKDVAIYSVDGSVIYQFPRSALITNSLSGNSQQFSWKLVSSRGKPISPGIYTIIVTHTSKTKTSKQKLLLIP